MNWGKTLLAALVGGIIQFFLGWAIYGIALESTFAPSEEMAKCIMKPFVMWAMIVSCLAWGFMFAYIFAKWAGIKTFGTGAVAGAIIAALVSLSVDMSMFSFYSFMSIQNIVIDIVAAAFISAITGGAIGWMLGRDGGAS